MQKDNASKSSAKANKSKNTAKPVYKPYLRGTVVSRLAAKRSLHIMLLMALLAFFGALISGVLSLENTALRFIMNAFIVAMGASLLYNNGARQGENDVAFGEIALKHQNEGTEVTAKEKDACYHPCKGFFTALVGAAPFLLIAIVYALIAEKQTYTLGVLPNWVQSYETWDDIGPALAYYHETASATLGDWLRVIVRLMLFPFMNMFGGSDYSKLYVLDRISPLLTLILPTFYGLGYLRGPYLRALVHGNIRLARRRQNRDQRKAREQRAKKTPQKKELI